MAKYQTKVYDMEGRFLLDLPPTGSVPAARQTMLDHAGVNDLPNEEPFFCPEINVLEGWYIGRREYCIGMA